MENDVSRAGFRSDEEAVFSGYKADLCLMPGAIFVLIADM
jgi:hypothetical protein